MCFCSSYKAREVSNQCAVCSSTHIEMNSNAADSPYGNPLVRPQNLCTSLRSHLEFFHELLQVLLQGAGTQFRTPKKPMLGIVGRAGMVKNMKEYTQIHIL